MADNVKVLGQITPSANTLTNLYTVPSVTYTAVSSLFICNTSAISLCTIRISIAIGGASDNIKQYLYYDLPIDTNDTFVLTVGMTLGTTDVVRVYSSLNNTSFNLFGLEIT